MENRRVLKKGQVDENDRQLRIIYVRLPDVRKWDRNPKIHDIDNLIKSMREHGFRDAPIWDETLGAIVGGNGRTEALQTMIDRGLDPPVGILIDRDTDDWCMPVQVGIDAESSIKAEAFAVDHNNLTLMGGELTVYDIARLWRDNEYLDILKGLAEQGTRPTSVDEDDLELLMTTGWEFDPLPDIDGGDEIAGRDFMTIKVEVSNLDDYEDAIVKIRQLVDDNPNWGADVK